MSKFSTKRNKRNASISTASLPDIVFMMLFFFMVVATIKEDKELVKTEMPAAAEVTAPATQDLVRQLTVGRPVGTTEPGTYQLAADGRFLGMEQLAQWLNTQKDELPEYQRDQLIVMVRADKAIEMGVISDIQQTLRKNNVRKVLYRTLPQ